MSDNGTTLFGVSSHFVAEDDNTRTHTNIKETNMDKKTMLYGVDTSYEADFDGVFNKHSQHIQQSFLDNIKEQRNRSTEQREGEFMSVATIPTIVVEKWMREGFNIMSGEHSAAEIVKRLKAENLEAFLTTEKSV